VFNTNSEVIESQILTGETEIKLEPPKITSKGKTLSYWSIEREKDKLKIEPILIDAKEILVNFYTSEGGKLLENNAQIKEIAKSVNKGTYLNDILPEVSPKNGYKFAGWFKTLAGKEEKLKDIDELKVLDSKGGYYAKFYPDLNGNDIDDQTEEIVVKYVTNSSEKLADVKTTVGSQIKLPKVAKKDSIFMGWYTDEEYKNQFKEDVVTESLTLYAKWGNVEKVIKEAEQKPVTDKDISDQIEKILNERLKEFNTTNSVGASSNQAIQTPKVTTNVPTSSSPNIQKNEPDTRADQQNSVPPVQNNVFKETKYVFNNKNLGQKFMVKFLNEDENFLFSLTLPYGKTIRIFDENERFHEEYAVRQDTTIILNSNEYINEGSRLLEYETQEARVNSARITDVYPVVEVENSIDENLAYENAKALEEEYQTAKSTRYRFSCWYRYLLTYEKKKAN